MNIQCQQNFSKIDDFNSTVLATCVAELYTDVVIDCQFSSNPSGNLTVIYPKTIENIQIMNETKIVITNFTTSNGGVYSCVVNNVLISGERGRQTLMVTISYSKPICSYFYVACLLHLLFFHLGAVTELVVPASTAPSSSDAESLLDHGFTTKFSINNGQKSGKKSSCAAVREHVYYWETFPRGEFIKTSNT